MKTISRLSFLVLLLGIGVNVCAQDLYADNYHSTKTETDRNIEKNSKSEDGEKVYKWEFSSSTPSTFDENTMQRAEAHEFGSRVACLKVLMNKYFVTQEEIVPGDPMKRTIIKKPNVYNTAQKIEKYLKKEVKKGDISLEKATSELIHVLEVSLAVVDESETTTFEKTLDENKKNVEDQLSVFEEVKIKNIY